MYPHKYICIGLYCIPYNLYSTAHSSGHTVGVLVQELHIRTFHTTLNQRYTDHRIDLAKTDAFVKEKLWLNK